MVCRPSRPPVRGKLPWRTLRNLVSQGGERIARGRFSSWDGPRFTINFARAMEGFPRKIACQEKAHLLRRRAAAESDYRRAIPVLGDAIGVLEEPNADELDDFADSARRIVENAQEALERHTSEHAC